MTPQLVRGSRFFVPRISRVAASCLAFCTLALAPFGSADSTSGQFVVRAASTHVSDGVYYVNAEIDYSLTDPAIQALGSGVPLTFEVQIEVSRPRRLLPDDTVAKLSKSYELSFHALTERYVVRNLNSGEQANFGTLAAALHGMGQIHELPVIDGSLLNPERDYRISLRSTLDLKSFPGPLRLLASLFRFNDWRLASKWHSWALNP